MIFGRLLFIAFISTSLLSSTARAERVGYRFTGKLNAARIPGATLFDTPLPNTESDVVGTFSYDTTAVGVDFAPGVRNYSQLISGGYSLDINWGGTHMLLEASDYSIGVANDVGSSPSDIFGVTYNYDYNPAINRYITPKPIVVDGVEWTGPRAFLNVRRTWDATQFPDPDEPKLTPDRPTTPGFYNQINVSNVGSSGTPQFINNIEVEPISPQTGDYNFNGKIDAHDYVEWRKAFGHTEPEWMYADGNHDGIVDLADYLVWRKAPATSLGLSSVPEPSGLTMIATWIVLFVGSGKTWRRDAQQR